MGFFSKKAGADGPVETKQAEIDEQAQAIRESYLKKYPLGSPMERIKKELGAIPGDPARSSNFTLFHSVEENNIIQTHIVPGADGKVLRVRGHVKWSVQFVFDSESKLLDVKVMLFMTPS